MSIQFPDSQRAEEFAQLIQEYRGTTPLNKARQEMFEQASESIIVKRSGAEMAKGVSDLIAHEISSKRDQKRGGVSEKEGWGTDDPSPYEAPEGYGDQENEQYLKSIRFSNNEPAFLPHDKEELDKALSDLSKRMPGIGEIHSTTEIKSAGGFIAGLDRVNINPEYIHDLKELEEVVLHEAVGHRMIHAILGLDYQDTMLEIYGDLKGSIRSYMDAYEKHLKENWYKAYPELDSVLSKEMLEEHWDNVTYNFDYKTEKGKIQATEEWIAMQVEHGDLDRSGWYKFVGWFRDKLRSLGFSPQWKRIDVDYLITSAFKYSKMPMNSKLRSNLRTFSLLEALNKKNAPLHRTDLSYTDLTPEQTGLIGKMAPHITKPGAKDIMHHVKKTFATSIFDQVLPVAKEVGQGAYKLVRLAKRKDGVLMTMLQYGGVKVGKAKLEDINVDTIDIDTKLPGFFNTLKPLGTESERVRWFAWLAANRADQNRRTDVGERWFTDKDIDIGMTLNNGTLKNAVTGKREKREKVYKNLRREFQEYNDSIIKIGKQFGIFGSEADRWRTDFYVPFWREVERQIGDTRGLRGPVNYKELVDIKSPVYKYKAADMQTKDIFNNVVQNWSNILDASLKNQAGFETLKKAENIVDPVTGLKLAEKVDEPTHRSVHVLVNGQKHFYNINNEPLFEALSSVHESDLRVPGLEWAIKAKRFLTLGVTSSPDFKIRNAIRDSLTIMGTTDVGFNVAKNFFGGFSSLKDREFKGRMLTSGGYMQFGFMENQDPRVAEKMLARDLKMSYVLDNREAKENFQAAWSKQGRILRRLWSRYQDWGDTMENANRAALFKKKIGEGKSDLEAAYHARDVLDFSLHGKSQFVRAVIATVPFANALLQSKYKTYRGWRDYRSAFYTMAVTMMGLSMAEYEMYGDDDDWRGREEWDKDTFFWFKIPGTDTAFRIPKPHEFAIIGNMSWRLADMAFKDDPVTKEMFISSLSHALKNEFYMTPMPQIISPLVELGMDRDFFTGRPIEGLMREFASPTERTRLYTTSTAIAASRELFDKSPIDAFKLSPIQIEHLIKGYTGFLGESALFISDLFVSKIYDMPSSPMRRLTDWPVAKSFFQRTPLRNTMYGNVIYQHFKTIEQAYADITTARRIGDLKRYKELIEDNRDLLYWNSFIKANKRRLTDISTRIKQVKNSRYLEPESKRLEIERLEQIRNAIAERTVLTVLR